VIAPVTKATAVLARDVTLEPASLPDKGRAQTKEAVVMGEDVIFWLAPKKTLFGRKNKCIFLSEWWGSRVKGVLHEVRRRGEGERESLCGEDVDVNLGGERGNGAVLLFWKKKKMAPKNIFSFLARG
jgi:hypothetical protein